MSGAKPNRGAIRRLLSIFSNSFSASNQSSSAHVRSRTLRDRLEDNSELVTGCVLASAALGFYVGYKNHWKPWEQASDFIEDQLKKLWPKRKISEEAVLLKQAPQVSIREQRFMQFATCEYNGHLFMTPRDFLDSVTQEFPSYRQSRRILTDQDVQKMLRSTPVRGTSGSSAHLFRDIDRNGLVSFTEYLFLLCVLTKPKAGFRIAFNMFDMDGNQQVDKREFLVIQVLILLLRGTGKLVNLDAFLESMFARKTNMKKSGDSEKTEEGSTEKEKYSIWDAESHASDMLDEVQDTTLLLHLFGPKGGQVLAFDDFYRFYDNLQTEVLEIEFNEFSQGKRTISEIEFAKILLRYTIVHIDEYQKYLRRIQERIKEIKGITFDQFRQFCQFLNHLEDFTIAVKLYTFANRSITQPEFARAVKVSTGQTLDPHVVNTVFQIFDADGDGDLSYSEFTAVMKDRLHRGFRSHLMHQEGWNAFKSCVKDEMKTY